MICLCRHSDACGSCNVLLGACFCRQVFEELYDYCCAVAGASLHAADRLCRGEADVAINWGGGRWFLEGMGSVLSA